MVPNIRLRYLPATVRNIIHIQTCTTYNHPIKINSYQCDMLFILKPFNSILTINKDYKFF